jgi:transposase
MTLVGLDVHARQTHAAVLDRSTSELAVGKLRMAPAEVVSFLAGLGSELRAVYEAGPTGFGLARAARERGLDVRVAAPGSIPRGSSDRVKTDRRDAARLLRLLAAGELSFALFLALPMSVSATSCDARGDLIRARHRRSKFLAPSGASATRGQSALGQSHTCRGCARTRSTTSSQATFVDYLSAVELLAVRCATLIDELERAISDSSHARVIARLRCLRGLEALSDVKTYPDRGGHTDPHELAIERAQAGISLHAIQLVVRAEDRAMKDSRADEGLSLAGGAAVAREDVTVGGRGRPRKSLRLRAPRPAVRAAHARRLDVQRRRSSSDRRHARGRRARLGRTTG